MTPFSFKVMCSRHCIWKSILVIEVLDRFANQLFGRLREVGFRREEVGLKVRVFVESHRLALDVQLSCDASSVCTFRASMAASSLIRVLRCSKWSLDSLGVVFDMFGGLTVMLAWMRVFRLWTGVTGTFWGFYVEGPQ